MYLKDFGAEPSFGNLHLSTYLENNSVKDIIYTKEQRRF